MASPDHFAWREVLRRYPPDCRPIGEVEALGSAGGFSGSRLWRIASPRGMLVLRAWPRDGFRWTTLDRINAWLRSAEALPFVPVPIRSSDGRTSIEAAGRAWSLTPWMPGEADPIRPPSPDHIRAGFEGLAAFHRRFAPDVRSTSPGIADRLADLERWIGGDFARIRGLLRSVGSDPRSDLTRAWVERAMRKAPVLRGLLLSARDLAIPVQPCLRDARPDHFLFDGGRLTGLIDFGAMGMETVAADLARLMGEWLGADLPARALAEASYRAIRPLDDGEARLIPAFEAANAVLGAGRWARWHFFEGRRFEDPDAVAEGLRRCLRRMDEAERLAGPFRT
ncbi:phosphotransferase enzyme family protein [Tundrisphaera sp. TA3]|uniref:phosphotransferase enzyme family protein n=1 Tax=Tundrisphaera sp. TA3 TaxID=3435775 RepID=UPI003EBEA939